MAVATLPGSTAADNLCGAAVGGFQVCQSDKVDCGSDYCCTTMLWDQVGHPSFNCMAYDGPCHIGYGDMWKDKNPLNCKGDTFYLWDDSGASVNWAVNTWKQFVQLYGDELETWRKRGKNQIVTSLISGSTVDSTSGEKNIEFLVITIILGPKIGKF